MSAVVDMTGCKFGRLTVLRRAGSTRGLAAWECRCECGRLTVTTGDQLRQGRTKSCGCLQGEVRRLPHARRQARTGPRTDLAERFWAKVDKRGPDDCWLWQGSRTALGYGIFYFTAERPKRPAHQVALVLTVGETPEGCTQACHHCDNPPCVNPAHLYWGTAQTNVADMNARGRASGGVAKRSRCRFGHPYVPDPNRPGVRMCRDCHAANLARKVTRRQERYWKLRELGIPGREAKRLSAQRNPLGLLEPATPAEVGR